MSAPSQSESDGESGSSERPQSQQETNVSRRPQPPAIWLPFGVFVLGFVILVAESKYTLPAPADYALKGLGGGLCLVTVVWIRRQARKAGLSRPVKKPVKKNE